MSIKSRVNNFNEMEVSSRYFRSFSVDPYSKSHIVLLPNLRLKENKIYFTLKSPLKICIKKKNTFVSSFLINNVSMYGKTEYNDVFVNYDIINEECNNGLKIKIMYDENNFLYSVDIKKIAKNIECDILGIIDNITENKCNEIKITKKNINISENSDKENSMQYDSYSDTESMSYKDELYDDNDYDNYDEDYDYDN